MNRGILLAVALMSSGCATMVNGRSQDVLVLSEPSGASIRLNGQPVGSTPTTVRMRRRGAAELVVAKAGYAPASIPVERKESGWMFGNFIFLNPLAAQGMDSMGLQYRCDQGHRAAIGMAYHCKRITCTTKNRFEQCNLVF